MIPNIEYLAPKTVQEALQLLNEKENCKLLAGGTDVITGFHQESSRFKDTGCLIDINYIAEMQTITEDADSVTIGAGCTFTSIVESEIVQREFPLLAQASSGVGSLQIRNRATIAGNFVNNAPCADSVPALLVYDAEIAIASINGTRTMPLQDFLLRPYRTQLLAGEIVTSVVLRKLSPAYHGSYYKLGRRRGVAISRITVAALLKIENNIITDCRLAGGAATPIGMRFSTIEQLALNQPLSDGLLRTLAIETGKLVLEKTGLRWSTAYKLPVLQQVCYQELVKAAKGKE